MLRRLRFTLYVKQLDIAKMVPKYLVISIFIIVQNSLVNCASAGLHTHSIDNVERESDGSYRPRDSEHYNDSRHNSEFDHEAILGSVREAEEFDSLTPEESKKRLGELLLKMDLNGDKFIDRIELKKWILKSFGLLSKEEAAERLSETDVNKDGMVCWSEYLQEAFSVDTEEEVAPDDTGDTGMLLREEKEMWAAADANSDGKLDLQEFEVFTSPEEHSSMHPYIVKQTLREKDTNNDGKINFQEFIGERGIQQDKEWVMSEQARFDHDLDVNSDGELDFEEIRKWVVPDNEEIADEEVDHLFVSADDDHDDLLSFDEVLEHHDVFVGSEATDFGDDLRRSQHFDDEL